MTFISPKVRVHPHCLHCGWPVLQLHDGSVVHAFSITEGCFGQGCDSSTCSDPSHRIAPSAPLTPAPGPTPPWPPASAVDPEEPLTDEPSPSFSSPSPGEEVKP